MVAATDDDHAREYVSLDNSVAAVADVEAAVAHIRRFSGGHSEAIVMRDQVTERRFVAAVDSAAVLVNASTCFTDGAEFGFGAEIGISTQKLHAGADGAARADLDQVRRHRGRPRAVSRTQHGWRAPVGSRRG